MLNQDEDKSNKEQEKSTSVSQSIEAEIKSVEGQGNGLAIASLISSFFVPFLGIILGFISKSKSKKSGFKTNKLATAGIIIGFIFTAIGLAITTLLIVWAVNKSRVVERAESGLTSSNNGGDSDKTDCSFRGESDGRYYKSNGELVTEEDDSEEYNGCIGTVTIKGYASVESASGGYDGSETGSIVRFHITENTNSYFEDFLSKFKNSEYVNSDSFSLGCLQDAKIHQMPVFGEENIQNYTNETDTAKFLASSRYSQVTIKATRSVGKVMGGIGGSPICYSYLGSFKVLATDDYRAKLANEVNQKIDESYLIGKVYRNYAASGETGVFEAGGILSLSWGLDYAGPNDDRPRAGTGSWSVNEADGTLTISGSNLSNGTYRDIKFYSYGEDIFGLSNEGYVALIIGGNESKVDGYFDYLQTTLGG